MPKQITLFTTQKVLVYPEPIAADGSPAVSVVAASLVLSNKAGGAATEAAGIHANSRYIEADAVASTTTWDVDIDADFGAGVTTVTDTLIVRTIAVPTDQVGLVSAAAVPK